MRSHLSVWFFLFVSTLAAQDRAQLRGVARTAAGKAWANATVVLHARHVRGFEAFGEADRTRVVTDERGRFAAMAIAGRPYLVWAYQVTKRGTHRASRPRVGVLSGRTVRLHETTRELVAPKLALRVAPEWKRPLTAKLTTAQDLRQSVMNGMVPRLSVPFVMPVTLDENESLQIPRLPWSDCSIEVYDARGIQLATVSVELSAERRRQQLALPKPKKAAAAPAVRDAMLRHPPKTAETAALERSEFAIPAGGVTQLQVRLEKRAGEPVGRAEIMQRVRGKAVRLTSTDSKGVAAIRLPFGLPAMPFSYPLAAESARLIVRAKGLAETDARDSEANQNPLEIALPGGKTKKVKQGPVAVVQPGTFLTGRLLCKGKAVAKTDVVIEIIRSGGKARQVPGVRTEIVRTDQNGDFRLEHVNAGNHFRIFALPSNDILADCTNDGRRPFRQALVAVGRTTEHRTALGDLELSEVRQLTIAVHNPDGTPASDAALGFMMANANPALPLMLLQPAVNRRGQVTVIAADLAKLTASAITDRAWGFVQLDKLGKDESNVTLRLQAPIAVSGVVKTPDGQPASQVMVQVYPSGDSNSFNNVSLFIERFFGTTDGKGRFDFWLPGQAEAATATLAQFRDGRPIGMATHQIQIENGAARGLELELRRFAGMGPAAPAAEVEKPPAASKDEKKAPKDKTKKKR